jgi:hypothetical protein
VSDIGDVLVGCALPAWHFITGPQCTCVPLFVHIGILRPSQWLRQMSMRPYSGSRLLVVRLHGSGAMVYDRAVYMNDVCFEVGSCP